MRILIAIVALFLAGCVRLPQPTAEGGGNTDGGPVYYYHDDVHNVSCWLYGSVGTYGRAISCLPD